MKIKYITTLIGLFLVTLLVAQEQGIIKGIILDTDENPVSNVQIIISGVEPVYTGEDGRFQLQRLSDSDWLTVKPLNEFHGKEILLTDQSDIKVYVGRLSIDSRFDVVSLSVGDKNRGDIIGSFSTIDVDDFYKHNYTTVEQSLQGKTSGALVTNSSGMPGSGASVYLRGFSSLLTNNQPLYIIDGVPLENSNVYQELIEGYNYNPLASIDPMDITKMTVLKDAASTAIYGVKGANGVVLIETLEPEETKTTIDVLYRSGLTMSAEQLPQLEATHYKNLANEILFTNGDDQKNNIINYPGLYYTKYDEEFVKYNHNTNWQNEIFRNASMQNVHFSIKGGDAIAKYGLSLGYLNSNGIVKNTSLDRINIRLVGAFDIFSWLSMDVSTTLATNTSYLKESGLSPVTNPIYAALSKSPLLNPYEYDDNGDKIETIDEVEELSTSNPAAIIQLFEGKSKNYRFMGSVVLNGDISENFKFKSVVSLNSNNLKEYVFIPDQGFDLHYNSEVWNVTKAQNSNLNSFYNDNQMYYTKKFSSLHSLHAGVGLRWQSTTYDIDKGIGKNTPSDYYTNLNRGTTQPEIGALNRAWNWAALYSNITYSYADKYILAVNLSADFSSRFGKQALNTISISDVPVGGFYSIAGAWRLSEEDFFPEIDGMEELKLRVSMGTSGNDDIGELNSYGYYSEDQYRGTTVLVPGNLTNNKLTYQNKKQFNAGLDFSLWANHLSLTFDFYKNISSNVLLYELQSNYTGYNVYPNNSASISNVGFDLNAFYRIVDKKDYSFDVGLNFTKFNSTIDEISEGDNIIVGIGDYELINRTGQPVNSFYGYQFNGVYSTYEEAQIAGLYNTRGLSYERGDAIFENTSATKGGDDKVINSEDKQILGSFNPDFFGGIFLNGRYKNWSINLFFQGVYGNEIYNYCRYMNERMLDLANQSVKTLQRWQYEGQETIIPKATWGDPKDNSAFSSRWIEDGSYLRLKQLSINYKMKRNIIGLTGLTVFATATNLFTLSAYKGYDPEFSYSQNLTMQGIDFANTPVSRQFMLGIKLGL